MTALLRPFLKLLPALLLTACHAPGDTATPPQPVAHVDLHRYQGLWYEVASIPNRFQKQCAAATTAAYALRQDGGVEVTNRCRTHAGSWDEARGVARVLDSAYNARLQVSFVDLFGWQLFWGDYWVLDLAPDYSYVTVGTPDRRYGWILSRTPKLPSTTRQSIDQRLRAQGYDPDAFVDTPQPP
jgi:apolipoprotein D and lipocalin family protein